MRFEPLTFINQKQTNIMTTNHFLCIMAGVFLAGTTFFFKDKSNTLQKENIKLKHQIDSLKVKTK